MKYNKRMKTIIVIARLAEWKKAEQTGQYTQSTIDSTLAEVGFLHCSFPDQTIEIANRKYADQNDLLVVCIDAAKVTAPIQYEGAVSGRAGTFPHIYGPLNVDAAYATAPLKKNDTGAFVAPEILQEALHSNSAS